MVVLRKGDEGFGETRVNNYKYVPSVTLTAEEYGLYLGSEEYRMMVMAHLVYRGLGGKNGHRRWLLYVGDELREDHRMDVVPSERPEMCVNISQRIEMMLGRIRKEREEAEGRGGVLLSPALWVWIEEMILRPALEDLLGDGGDDKDRPPLHIDKSCVNLIRELKAAEGMDKKKS